MNDQLLIFQNDRIKAYAGAVFVFNGLFWICTRCAPILKNWMLHKTDQQINWDKLLKYNWVRVK